MNSTRAGKVASTAKSGDLTNLAEVYGARSLETSEVDKLATYAKLFDPSTTAKDAVVLGGKEVSGKTHSTIIQGLGARAKQSSVNDLKTELKNGAGLSDANAGRLSALAKSGDLTTITAAYGARGLEVNNIDKLETWATQYASPQETTIQGIKFSEDTHKTIVNATNQGSSGLLQRAGLSQGAADKVVQSRKNNNSPHTMSGNSRTPLISSVSPS